MLCKIHWWPDGDRCGDNRGIRIIFRAEKEKGRKLLKHGVKGLYSIYYIFLGYTTKNFIRGPFDKYTYSYNQYSDLRQIGTLL